MAIHADVIAVLDERASQRAADQMVQQFGQAGKVAGVEFRITTAAGSLSSLACGSSSSKPAVDVVRRCFNLSLQRSHSHLSS
jgi:hypothetical protein